MNKHIIHKQKLNIAHSHTLDSYELPMQIQKLCNDQLENILNNICQHLSLEDQHVQINSLSINLNNIRQEFFKEEFTKKLENELTSQISYLLNQQVVNNYVIIKTTEKFTKNNMEPELNAVDNIIDVNSSPTSENKSIENSASLQNTHEEPKPENVEQNNNLCTTPSAIKLLEHYFNTGNLPSWDTYRKHDINQLVNDCLINHKKQISQLIPRIVKQKTALKRFIHSLKDETIDKVIQAWELPVLHKLIETKNQLLHTVKRSNTSSTMTYDIKELIYGSLLISSVEITGTNNESLQQEKLKSARIELNQQINKLFKHNVLINERNSEIMNIDDSSILTNHNNHHLANNKSSMSEEQKNNHHELSRDTDKQQTFPKKSNLEEKNTSNIPSESSTEDPSVQENDNIQQSSYKKIGKSETERFSSVQSVPTDKNAYWVSNAGVVLLWPFLEGFFTEEKLIIDQNFKDDYSLFKAIQYLQYLSTGSDDYEDFETYLSKMLCGLAPNDLVPVLPALDNMERIRADNLVGAMIKNWPVVKDTSVESIRETFFIRCGEIVRKDNGWLLQIEKKTYDVLLGKLPWNIGIIYLPWCNELLHVNWE